MSYSRSANSNPITEPEGGTWHFANLSDVRAYRFNWDDQCSFDGIVDDGGELNSTRWPLEGIVLNASQVSRLKAAVTGSHPCHPTAACFYPHHAFVFYDDQGRMVGYLNLCFLCSNYSGVPDEFADLWDLEALAAILGELGMPLRNPQWGEK